jgi:hypothetical protein
VRQRAFAFLKEQVTLHGDVLTWASLLAGFQFDGHRVPLIGPQGIFKPVILDLPLTISTAPPAPGKTPPYDCSATITSPRRRQLELPTHCDGVA